MVAPKVADRLATEVGTLNSSIWVSTLSGIVAAEHDRDGARRGDLTDLAVDQRVRPIDPGRDDVGIAGIDHVGLGGDYDGTDELPDGLEDVSKYPALLAELLRRGWTDADVRKLAGENILRVWAKNEQVAARLRRERPPSLATIEALDGAAR